MVALTRYRSLTAVIRPARSQTMEPTMQATIPMEASSPRFDAGTSILAGVSATLVFGLVPAFRNAKSDLQGVLKEGAGGASPGRNRATLRQALVVGEIALAVMLVIGAGLLLTSLVRLQRVDTGFDGTGTVVMDQIGRAHV